MDSDWVQHTFLPSAITAVVLLLVLWPTRQSGRRLLRNWGVAAPSTAQIAEAGRYLRRRRILYVVLILLVPAVDGLIWPKDRGTPWNVFVPFLAAMVIAELIAAMRPVSGVRVASLDRRTWRDLVPRWAIVFAAVLTALAVGLAVLGLSAQPWVALAVHGDKATAPIGWYTLGSVALCLIVVGTLVYLAVRRPAVSDAAVDFALRTRTARVGVAIGFGWLAGAVGEGEQRISTLQIMTGDANPPGREPGWLVPAVQEVVGIVGLTTFIVAIACWLWLAMPSRRSLARTAAPAR